MAILHTQRKTDDVMRLTVDVEMTQGRMTPRDRHLHHTMGDGDLTTNKDVTAT